MCTMQLQNFKEVHQLQRQEEGKQPPDLQFTPLANIYFKGDALLTCFMFTVSFKVTSRIALPALMLQKHVRFTQLSGAAVSELLSL